MVVPFLSPSALEKQTLELGWGSTPIEAPPGAGLTSLWEVHLSPSDLDLETLINASLRAVLSSFG